MAEAEAAVAILHARGPVESVLLMRRAERADDPWSGHWSFPGGRRDPSDPDLLHTALRELGEECGVTLGREQLESALPSVNARRRTGMILLVAPFVFRLASELDAVPDLDEAVEARWVPLEFLRNPALHGLRPVPGLPEGMLFPSVPLGEMPLWGFTYRLITEWLGLMPEAGEGIALVRRQLAGVSTPGEAAGRLRAGWSRIPPVNMLELRQDGVHVVGLDFEEHWIAFA